MFFSRPGRHLRVASMVAALAAATAVVHSQAPQSPAAATVTFEGQEVRPGEVLVQFANAAAAAAVRDALGQQIDADENVPVGRAGLQRFHSRVFDVSTLISFFRTQPGVVFAEPNYILHAIAVPNDPSFPNLWGLRNTGQFGGTPGADIDATSAWNVSTGSRSNVVAIIDTGVDYTHPDLAGNVWSAPAPFTVTIGGETFTCPAGSHGYNAIPKPRTALLNCNPMDDNNHGSHVAGTIGAVGNNGTGVAGVNWTASMIGAKFLNSGGSGSTSDAIDAIDFLVQAKTIFSGTGGANVRVINASWGGGGFSSALRSAIANAYANDMLFVAAAGNSGTNTDISPFYPAGYDVNNVIAVAATDYTDFKASFSNYGATTVDLAAPGVSILSTVLGGGYSYFNGTSMASPHVAGAAALVLSRCTLTTDALKTNILNNVDVLGSLSGLVQTSGRLNVNNSILACSGTPSAPPAPTGLTATPGDRQVQLSWNPAAGATSYNVKRSTTGGGPYTAIATGITSTNYLDTGLTNGVPYFYVVSAVNAVGEGPDSAEASATPGTVSTLPLAPQNLKAFPGDATVSLTWVGSADASSYRVKRSLVRSGPYSVVATVGSTNFTDTGLTNGTKYFYLVTAVNAAGESPNSNKVGVVPMPVPAAPTGVTANPGANTGEIALSWNASAWASAYKVRRGTTSGGPYGSIKKVTGLNYTQTGLTSGRRYYFIITALNTTGESGPSLEVSAIAR